MSLRSRFQRFRAPGEEEAQERSWRVVSAAFEEAPPARGRAPRRSRRPRALAIAAAGAALVALAVTPAGATVADWIEDVVERDSHDAPRPLRLPADGRLLVNTAAGPWLVHRDGSKRLLADYAEASWSPGGLFVVATRGRQLYALEPGGRIRWELPAPRPVRSPRWAPSGFRIAYLSGPALRVVAGDGTGDRQLARGVDATPPAWHPGPEHVLAYSDASGRVTVANADSGDVRWRSDPAGPQLDLSWSADGARLVAAGRDAVRVFGPGGRLLNELPTGARATAFRRAGHAFALVRDRRGGGEVVLLDAERRAGPPRRVFAGPGPVSGIEWSPDSRWLLIQWDGSDQWLFVAPEERGRVLTADRIAERFDPGEPGAPQRPGRTEWCC